jgi:hypothetical protein
MLPERDELVAPIEGFEVPEKVALDALGGERADELAEQGVCSRPVAVRHGFLDARTGIRQTACQTLDLSLERARNDRAGRRRCIRDAELGNAHGRVRLEGHGRHLAVRTVGTGDDRERELEIVETSRERPEARQNAQAPRRTGRQPKEAGHRDAMLAGLEPVHATEVSRQSDRAAQVGNDLERRHAGRDGGCRSSARAAGRSLEVPGIRRAPEDGVVALVVGE